MVAQSGCRALPRCCAQERPLNRLEPDQASDDTSTGTKDHQIGNRPLLLYGVLFAIMGVQVLSVGLLAELINRLSRDRELPWIQERLGFGDPPVAPAPLRRP